MAKKILALDYIIDLDDESFEEQLGHAVGIVFMNF